MRVEKLPPGDYSLLLKDAGVQIRLRLTAGQKQKKFLLGSYRHLQLNAAPPLQLQRVEVGEKTVRVHVQNAGKFTRVHVFGTKGSAEVLDEATLIRRVSGSKPMRHIFPTINVLRAELDAFADAVDGKRPYPVAEADVLATLAAFEAALASMKSGQAVRCDGR